MTLVETIGDAAVSTSASPEVPTEKTGLRQALIAQREYTLALYADLPSAYWHPHRFPLRATINPPLWELAHIAWFQEFFALRWRADDESGSRRPSCFSVADQLFDSARVPHEARWQLDYPSRAECFDYMQLVLENVVQALEKSGEADRYGFQLVLLHEDMHAEALAMTLVTLGQALPSVAPRRSKIGPCLAPSAGLHIAGGVTHMGVRADTFGFDNEKPPHQVRLEPFDIDARVVSAAEFAAFRASSAYLEPRFWSAEGNAWRESGLRIDSYPALIGQSTELAAMHMNYFEAEAYCKWQNRRLPTEAEWECAATSSSEFSGSTGHVWEWTASPFAAYPGFKAERYREYSAPWFQSMGVRYQVLKGGSFVTHSRLKYPQFRNFYTPDRDDMFCGFRTCAIQYCRHK